MKQNNFIVMNIFIVDGDCCICIFRSQEKDAFNGVSSSTKYPLVMIFFISLKYKLKLLLIAPLQINTRK